MFSKVKTAQVGAPSFRGTMVPLHRIPFTNTAAITNPGELAHLPGPPSSSTNRSLSGSIIVAKSTDILHKYLAFMVGHSSTSPAGRWATVMVRGIKRLDPLTKTYSHPPEWFRFPIVHLQVRGNTDTSSRNASYSALLTTDAPQMSNRCYAGTATIVADFTNGSVRKIGEHDKGIVQVLFDAHDAEFIEVEASMTGPGTDPVAEALVVFGSGFIPVGD